MTALEDVAKSCLRILWLMVSVSDVGLLRVAVGLGTSSRYKLQRLYGGIGMIAEHDGIRKGNRKRACCKRMSGVHQAPL